MKRRDASQITKELAKNHACYVLITCDPPSADGNMQVCMSYEGDTALAAYLLKGAQTFIEEQDEEMEAVATNLRIIE
ncbi:MULTISPECIES: hypothetical protein [Parachlamydia]|jgi:hypothetical protein|uniref:Uncharacterized protein n=2 Tax=Parachlamydia acanthamoebae TaxID=83552 RepID=F8KZ39_PARAV|nr:hypothetical protein [Parachlamydia acanthamoebae]EFB41961.1 hypothetical protein pah_c022o298 [Parachlamydia acanthamoebae str. Hall's coccus]KIA78093.1 hypothetical protein DB43_EW00030 [Parachlamydia acanthamoebae]CCB86162.1 putative uncharacterized protein [Parachlamydia acanthamoebae UV-7]